MGHEGCASVMGEPCPFTWRTLKTSFVSCVWDLVFDPRVEAIHSLAKSISTSLLGVKKGTRASQRTPGTELSFQFPIQGRSPVGLCLFGLALSFDVLPFSVLGFKPRDSHILCYLNLLSLSYTAPSSWFHHLHSSFRFLSNKKGISPLLGESQNSFWDRSLR